MRTGGSGCGAESEGCLPPGEALILCVELRAEGEWVSQGRSRDSQYELVDFRLFTA